LVPSSSPAAAACLFIYLVQLKRETELAKARFLKNSLSNRYELLNCPTFASLESSARGGILRVQQREIILQVLKIRQQERRNAPFAVKQRGKIAERKTEDSLALHEAIVFLTEHTN